MFNEINFSEVPLSDEERIKNFKSRSAPYSFIVENNSDELVEKLMLLPNMTGNTLDDDGCFRENGIVIRGALRNVSYSYICIQNTQIPFALSTITLSNHNRDSQCSIFNKDTALLYNEVCKENRIEKDFFDINYSNDTNIYIISGKELSLHNIAPKSKYLIQLYPFVGGPPVNLQALISIDSFKENELRDCLLTTQSLSKEYKVIKTSISFPELKELPLFTEVDYVTGNVDMRLSRPILFNEVDYTNNTIISNSVYTLDSFSGVYFPDSPEKIKMLVQLEVENIYEDDIVRENWAKQFEFTIKNDNSESSEITLFDADPLFSSSDKKFNDDGSLTINGVTVQCLNMGYRELLTYLTTEEIKIRRIGIYDALPKYEQGASFFSRSQKHLMQTLKDIYGSITTFNYSIHNRKVHPDFYTMNFEDDSPVGVMSKNKQLTIKHIPPNAEYRLVLFPK